MKIVHWLFLVSVAAVRLRHRLHHRRRARTHQTRAGRVAERAGCGAPVASVKQIMRGIVGPAANVVFEAVSHHRRRPRASKRTRRRPMRNGSVGSSAAALVESANMLLVGHAPSIAANG